MNKMRKIAGAVALALGVGFASHANAVMNVEADSKGDALIFPLFHGQLESYFVIMNHSDNFIQGHFRIRGGGWSNELRDYDVVLSPRDVFVFRYADVDGDGRAELDMALDSKNFEYVGLYDINCAATGETYANLKDTLTGQSHCIDVSYIRIPSHGVNTTDYDAAESAAVNALYPPLQASGWNRDQVQAAVRWHKEVGHAEFIAEGVFDGLTKPRMAELLTDVDELPVDGEPEKRAVGNKRGVSLWSWNRAGKTISDVGNVLSGTALLVAGTVPSAPQMAYNALAIQDFRTNGAPHRLDNYSVAVNNVAQTGVILHHDDGNSNPFDDAATPLPEGDYIFGWPLIGEHGFTGRPADDDKYEARLSYENTWGPTLADGDDSAAGTDPWDVRLGGTTVYTNAATNTTFTGNSVREVEAALMSYNGGSEFSSFYLHNYSTTARDSVRLGSSGTSFYAYTFPTKYMYAESSNYHGATSFNNYLLSSTVQSLKAGQAITPRIWDTNENEAVATPEVIPCLTSPCPISNPIIKTLGLGFETGFIDIAAIKDYFVSSSTNPFASGGYNAGMVSINTGGVNAQPWPGLFYTFELGVVGGSFTMQNFRPMHHN